MHRARRRLYCILPLLFVGCHEGTTEPIVPDAVRLAAVADTVAWDETTRLTASYEVAGATVPSDEGLRWISTEPQYFSIDSLTGEGQAHETYELAARPVRVIARSHGVADTTTVIIVPRIAALHLIVSSSVALGRTFAPVLQAEAGAAPFVKDYTPPPESGTPTFRSSNPDVVSVGADGRFVAYAAGQAWVVATLRGISDSMQVRVGAGYPIALVPNSAGLDVLAVNDAGQVVGKGSLGSTTLPAVLLDGGTATSLGTCDPRDMNNAGQVVCGDGRVFANGSFQPPPSGQSYLSASGITPSGTVLGMHATALSTPEPIMWDASGVVVPVPAPSCCSWLRSTGKVNALGHGLATTSELYPKPVILRASGGIGLAPPGGRYAYPYAIDDADDVVGSSENQLARGNAVIWRAAEQWQGRFLGLRTTAASGISEDGFVVGTGPDGIFVWRDGRYALLSDLIAEEGWTISGVPAISRGGVIAVHAVHTSGKAGIARITPTSGP